MSTRWYIFKYVPDMFRNEPRNIGVVVVGEGCSEARFIGERNGRFDARRVGRVVGSARALQSWMHFVRHHISEGTFEEQVQKLGNRPLDNYRFEGRGALLDSVTKDNIHDVVSHLFSELVSDDSADRPNLDELANRILFGGLKLPPNHHIEREVKYRVKVREVERELRFDFRYVNGRPTLLDKISLSAGDIETRVNDLLFRMEHVVEQKIARSFVALYDAGSPDRKKLIEPHLRAIEEYSHTVNVRGEHAATEVGEFLGVETYA